LQAYRRRRLAKRKYGEGRRMKKNVSNKRAALRCLAKSIGISIAVTMPQRYAHAAQRYLHLYVQYWPYTTTRHASKTGGIHLWRGGSSTDGPGGRKQPTGIFISPVEEM